VPTEGGRRALLDGQWREFCCPGCEAVATAILGQGLGDYYRVRESLPERPEDGGAARDDLSIYDNPDVQATFVRSGPGGEREASLMLEGIRCSACVWLNEATLRRVPGVIEVDINYATHRARVRWNEGRVRLSRILEAIAAIGYRGYPYEAKRIDVVQQSERRSALWRLFVAGFGMMQVMMYAVPVYLADEGTMTPDIERLMRWASLILTAPVVFYSAQPFFRGAWRDLRLRMLGMDVPVALGVAVAFGASVWATLKGTGEVYFDSVTMFVFLLLAGRYLELRARHRAAGAIQYLARLQPEFAERLTAYPQSLDTESVPVAALGAGDLVLVKPGAAVPADGIVAAGVGEVSEAILTGESRPVAKQAGATVIGGAVNLGSPLVVRVERVGQETMLASIIRLVERAAGEKQRMLELADRAAHWFVLGILLVAAATALAWLAVDPHRALWITVSVLVVTCPCALSLATPVALTVATGELARNGFVVTRGHAVEGLARATDLVFDKTGTLTTGEMRVANIAPLGAMSEAESLAIAASLEQGSEHPIAQALLAAARERGMSLAPVEAIVTAPGDGVQATIAGRTYRLGRLAFASGAAAYTGPAPDEDPEHTIVWLGDETRILARIAVGDTIRPDARRAVASLEASGKRVHLVSGDSTAIVSVTAARLGIRHAEAEASPDRKREYVLTLQSQGARVIMVGDGVNDAPVLAQADVSVAMSSGAYLAQAQADAVLLTGKVNDLAETVRYAARTLRIIRQNLVWALGYNLIAVPLAVAGLVTPWLAGIGMSVSSLVVVANALRLRAFRDEKGAHGGTAPELAGA
jgi:Cu2+-exporting ATPase